MLSPGEPKSRTLPAGGSRTQGRGRVGRPPRVCIQFSEEMLAEIQVQAKKAGTSFSEQVRILVEWGLEAK
jgi:hypothetical protein